MRLLTMGSLDPMLLTPPLNHEEKYNLTCVHSFHLGDCICCPDMTRFSS